MGKEMKIKKVCDTEYYIMKNVIRFKTDDGIYEIDSKDVLELSYALLDSLGLKYEILEDVDEKLNGGN